MYISVAIGTKIIGGTRIISLRRSLLSRKEIHGRRPPVIGSLRDGTCRKGKKYKLQRYCRRNTVSYTTARVTRYARYRFFCIRAIEWDVSPRGIYRCTKRVRPWMALISGATISVVDFGSPCIIRRIPKAYVNGYHCRSQSIARLLNLIRKRDIK